MSNSKCVQVVDISAGRDGTEADAARQLLKSDVVEVIRLEVPAGKQRPRYSSSGVALVYCLEGRVALEAQDAQHDLAAGQMLYLPARTPHSLRGLDDAVLLLVMLQAGAARQNDVVQEASEESFPASDAPAWTPTSSVGSHAAAPKKQGRPKRR